MYVCSAANHVNNTEPIGSFLYAELVNISERNIGIIPFRYFTPFQDGDLYSDVTTQFTERVLPFPPLL